ncbi:MAG: hypothetical protein NZ517_07150 [Candidatus Nitrosocaldus sp.]|nr:hypothetical protein [Candidatus Nitrosocaldus sp.]
MDAHRRLTTLVAMVMLLPYMMGTYTGHTLAYVHEGGADTHYLDHDAWLINDNGSSSNSIRISISISSSSSKSNDGIVPLLAFDRVEYTPFDIVGITLQDASRDSDPRAVDVVSVAVKGRNSSIPVYLRETSESSGVFSGSIRLTPNPLTYRGDLEVRRDDWIVAVYNTAVATSARIVYHEARLSFDRQYYYSTDRAEVRLEEPEADRDPYAKDRATVFLWSDTDTSGTRITLVESDVNTGIFTGIVKLSSSRDGEQPSLRVTDNDRIYARYLDDTLPYPVRLAADNVTTMEMRYVTAEAIFGTGIPASERMLVSRPEVITQFGEQIRVLSFGSKLAVKVELLNRQPMVQGFVCISQVKYSDGTVASISMVASELESNTRAIVTLPWTPDREGSYRIEVFVWDSIGKPVALAPVQVLEVDVV